MMRGILLLLVTIGLVVASIACGQREVGSETTPEVSAPAESSEPRLATRRSIAGCESKEAALEYRDWVGRDVAVKLLWNDLPEAAANLTITMGVRDVVDGGLAVHLMDFPLQTYYVNLWATSGHLRLVGDELVLDPCSAEVTEAPSAYGSL